MGQPTEPTSPLEPFPAATVSPGIEMSSVPADRSDGNDRNDNSHTYQTSQTSQTSPTAPSNDPIFSDRRNTVGRERRESVAALNNPNQRSSESIPRRLSKSFQESNLPPGFLAATADMTSTVMTAARSRSSTGRTRSSTASDPDERSKALQQQRQRTPSKGGDGTLETLDEQKHFSSPYPNGNADTSKTYGANAAAAGDAEQKEGSAAATLVRPTLSADEIHHQNANVNRNEDDAAPGSTPPANVLADADLYNDYDNGYHFPPKYSTGESFHHGAVAFWHYARTPIGFLVVLYGLNVVAWGGMLFLLLCNASPAMCYPTCNDINSPRRKWIEVDSQILNGLFCVTGFGLAPWRFRDMFYYLQWRIGKKEKGIRRLAGIHRGWLRLPGSQDLPSTTGPGSVPAETPCSAIPFPESKIPDKPLTGQRAPATRHWVIVFVLGMNIANTFLQAVLAGFMWGMNRYDRPSWSTGLFVALGCIAGALGGLGMFFEGKRVKGIEGVPLTDEDRAKLAHDRELGIYHYNNLKGKRPKEDKHTPDLEAGKT
ncbi:hypothetical protein HMPREF1624_01914 [Sporothrix schenckii ATCC 58251]|uniref:Uncharacterized protein n=1 Tax=Sporothrix schenckii (strain ATCC 58251 / de Perez 2211183) TaxID=1391915 RepID=U7PYF1_SPOS1|nr:hypothetical protein HMPREF1624_01914 [Sporothrix schenckii ATCC 58251]